MRVAITLVALTLLLVGCAAPPPPLSTSSGRPEVFLAATTKKQVMDRIVSAGLGRGLQIKSSNDYGVVLAKKAEGVAAAFLYGSRYDSTPELRVHFNLVDMNGGVQVYARGEIVTNPGSGFERVNDLTQSSGQDLQSMLMDLQRAVGSAPTSSVVNSVPVTSPAPAQPAQVESAAGPKPPTAGGMDMPQAERLARAQSCNAAPSPALIAKGPGFETYSVACSNGDTMMVRCEFGNCRSLK